MNDDIFGIDGSGTNEGHPIEVEEAAGNIAGMIPAPGYIAFFRGPENQPVQFPIACFALVEEETPEKMTAQVIRPMVLLPSGQIDDVEAIEGFLCVVGPGMSVEHVKAILQDAYGELPAAMKPEDGTPRE